LGRLQHRTVPGFTYFITTKAWENRPIFQVPENAEILLQCILRHRRACAYLLHEFVVMPNHLHLLITPSDEASLERVMQLIKGGSSHEIHLVRGCKMHIWQPGFHEESIRDLDDYRLKAGYIRNNPVHAGLVDKPEEWPYGSAAGKTAMDGPPERLQIGSSGAKAPQIAAASMSELKLRPPKLRAPRGAGC
jgi:REP-associated tyrosine transposase